MQVRERILSAVVIEGHFHIFAQVPGSLLVRVVSIWFCYSFQIEAATRDPVLAREVLIACNLKFSALICALKL